MPQDNPSVGRRVFSRTIAKTLCLHRIFISRVVGSALIVLSLLAVMLFGAFSGFARPQAAIAQAPNTTLNFQARILNLNGSLVPDGDYHIEFKIYDTVSSGGTAQGACSGNCLWMETRTGGDVIRVVNGYVSANLGSVTSFPSNMPWGNNLYVTMRVGGAGGSPSWDAQEMTNSGNRMKMSVAPVAFVANNVASGSTNSASTNSSTISIQSGNALGTTSNSGNITIDSGTATGTTGAVTIGSTNASAVLLGRAGLTVAIQGGVSVAETAALNGDVTIGNANTDLLTISSTIQGSNALVFEGATVDGFETTLAVQDPTADVTLRLPALAAGTYDVCTTSGNCLGTGDIIQGGNSYTTAVTIGTNDVYDLNLETSGVTRVTIDDTTGDVNFTGNLVVAATKSLTLTGGNTASRPASPTEGMIYFDTDTDSLLTYANGKWQSDRGEYIIVASNHGTDPSTQAERDSADYVTDGTADEVEINAALTAASGGKVILLGGTYVAAATILIPNNTTLAGVGAGTNVELGNLDATENLIENTDTTTGTGITIRDLTLDGRNDLNTAGTQYGIYFNTGSSSNIENVYLNRFRNFSIYLQDNSNRNTFDNVKITSGSGDAGIGIDASDYNMVNNINVVGSAGQDNGVEIIGGEYNTVTGSTFSGTFAERAIYMHDGAILNTVSANTINGAAILHAISSETNSGANIITGNTIFGTTGIGIVLNFNSDANTVTNNNITLPGTVGIYAGFSSDNNTIDGNTITYPGGATENDGIVVDGDANQITDNYISDSTCSTACTAIEITANADNTYISGNMFVASSGTAIISNSGTGTTYASQSVAESGLNTVFRQADSTTAFAIQNNAGTSLLNADTSGGIVTITGSASVSGDFTVDTTTLVVNSTTNAVSVGGTLSVTTLGSADTSTFLCRNTSNQLATCSSTPLTNSLTDNITDAFDLQEGTNNYFNINTTNAGENISFGNATTNPSYDFLGSGTLSVGGGLIVDGTFLAGNSTINVDPTASYAGANGGETIITGQTQLTVNTSGDYARSAWVVTTSEDATVAPSGYDGLTISSTLLSNANTQDFSTTSFVGADSYAGISGATSTTVGTAKAIQAQVGIASGVGSVITNASALYVRSSDVIDGSIVNGYGLYVENQTDATNDYGIYVAGADTYALFVDAGATRLDGTLEVQGLATLSAGLNVTGATANINASSNFGTNINTGSSTGAVAIGNSLAGVITLQSASTIGLTGTSTVTGLSAGAGTALTVNNSTSTGSIFVAQDNGTPVFTIADGGNISASGQLLVNGTGSNQSQFIVRANAGQTVANPLVLLQNSSSAELARINATTTSLYFGNAAGGNSAAGVNNTGIGASALGSVLTGTGNTTLGSGALASVSVNDNNTAVGYNAGNLATGGNNIFLGALAGDNVTTGTDNIIIGYNLDASAGGVSNELRIGGVLQGNTSTLAAQFNGTLAVTTLGATDNASFLCRNSSNILAGCNFTPLSSSITDNITDAFDLQEGTNNYININTTNASENISFGNATTNPSFNLLGSGRLTVGSSLTNLGAKLAIVGTADEEQLLIRANATQSNSNPIIRVEDSTGTELFSFRSQGASNLFIGSGAGQSVSAGNSNTGFGATTLASITTQSENTAFGTNVLQSATTGSNTGFGAYALSTAGAGSGGNTAIGKGSLQGNTTGSYNTALGLNSGYNNQTGDGNVLLGAGAGFGSGSNSYSNNTFVGDSTGNVITTGSNNILVGYHTGDNLTTGSNNIIIGYDLNASAAGVSNELRIGGVLQGDTSTLAAQFNGTLAVTTLGSADTSTFLCRNTSNQLATCSSTPITNALTDNIADAFDLQEGTNNYFNINTTNSSENISFGNATTNPSYSFLGSGTLSVTGSVSIGAGSSLRVVGGNTASRPGSPTEGMIYFDTDTDSLLTYANGKWQSDRGEYIVVAANDSTQVEKDSADYVADGTADEVEINAALTAGAGGKVILLPGTYVAAATILIPNNTTLAGSGPGTVIELGNLDATENLIENSDTTTGTGIIIRDIKLDGRNDLNTTGTQYGISFNTASSSRIENVYLTRFRNHGIYLQDSSNNNAIDKVNITAGSGDAGVGIDASDYNMVSSSYIVGASGQDNGVEIVGGEYNTVNGNTFAGPFAERAIYMRDGAILNTVSANTVNGTAILHAISSESNSGANIITGNTIFGTTGIGIVLNFNSDANTVTNNSITLPGTVGIYAGLTSDNNTIDGNTIVYAGGSTDNDGITVDGDGNQITDNYISDSTCSSTCYAIEITSNADNTYISGNMFSASSGTAIISNGGTATTFANQSISEGGLDTVFRQANSSIAFAVQNATGTSVFNVNTTSPGVSVDGTILVSGLATLNGGLTVETGDTFTFNGDAFTDFTGGGLVNTGGVLSVDTTSATGFFRNGGNDFGGNATLGTNTAGQTLTLETANSARFIVDSAASTLTGQGATTLTSSGTLTVSSATTNALTIDSGTTGAINIGTGANAKTLTLGSATGTAITNIQAGTGTAAGDLNVFTTAGGIINIGNNAVNNKVLNLGSTGTTAAASTVNIATTNFNGTQAVNIGNTTSANNVVFLQGGTSSTAIRLAAGANGTITVGSQTAANTVSIGTVGAAAFSSTVNIGTSTGAAQTVTVGSTNASSNLTLNAGSNAITANASGLTFSNSGARALTVAQSAASTAGNNLTVSAGGGGTGTGSIGGALNLQGGAAGGTNANGGNVIISSGTGTGTGVKGLVVIDTATYVAATVQNFTSNANITQANINSFGSILISGDIAGRIATLTDPTNTTAGRVVYVTNTGSVDITLAANTVGVALSITLKPASTATMYWNGVDWTAAGASSSTDLQAAYDNTATSAGGAEIVLSSTGTGGLTIRNDDGTAITGGLLEVQTSIGSSLFTVNNNATEYAANGGAESSTFTAWLPASGAPTETVARNTSDTGDIIATGTASASVLTTAVTGQGAENTLTAPLINGLKYQVSYAIKSSSTTGSFTELDTMYSYDGTAGNARHCVAGTAYYTTGTASQTTTTITGVGTTFTSAMVGMTFVFADGRSTVITGYTNPTTLTAGTSQNASSQNFGVWTAGYKVNSATWTRITCTFTAAPSGTTITASNSVMIRQTSAAIRTFYIDNLSVTVSADVNHAVDGSVDSALGSNWQAYDADGAAGTSTPTRDTTNIYDSSGAVADVTTAHINQGIRNNLTITPTVSTQYLVTFYTKLLSGTFTDITVGFLPAGGSSAPVTAQLCVDYNTRTLSTSSWTKITCIITTPSSGISDPDIVIYQPSATARTFYVDALSVTLNTNNSSNVQIGGGNFGGPTTLFTLDRGSNPPIAANNDAYLGSMYYDTNSGRIQCYEADGWGACGAAPDNIVNLNPEYAGAVLNGTGVGTMTSDFCGNGGGLSINTGLCDSGEAKNFYKWTSPQATQQTYSVYVTYQLPATFNGFTSDDTVQLAARVDNTTNASVTYEMFKSVSGALTQCGTGETNVITGGGGSANTWYSYGINGNEATGCSLNSSSANGFVIFKINMKANSNASAYVGTLNFVTAGR